MDNQPQKSKRNQEKSLLAGNGINKKVILDTLLATFIASTPLLFTLYESVPTTKVWDTFLFTYDSNFWEDANYAAWIFTGKAIPLFLLLIWFFTNKNWWYHAILVPIIMYMFQIYSSFKIDTTNIDESQLINMLPIMAIIIPSIYLIRAKMFDKINSKNKSMQELEEEFMIKPKGVWKTVKQYF